MPKKVEEKLHILCPSRAYLAPAKVMGPIVHPLQVTKSVAAQLLMSGAELHEYNPLTKKTIKLSLTNINNPKRFDLENHTPVKSDEVAVETVKKMGVPNIQSKEDTVVDPEVSTEETSTVEVWQMSTEEDLTHTENETIATTTITDDPIANLVFTYNEDGTVDESCIDWSSYTKSQRKAIRAKINEYNNSLVAEATTVSSN